MTEHVEHFGGDYELPEPKVIGDCIACNDEIYEFQDMICPLCGEFIHEKCQVRCYHCDESGCLHCMELDRENMEFFCGDFCRGMYEADKEGPFGMNNDDI